MALPSLSLATQSIRWPGFAPGQSRLIRANNELCKGIGWPVTHWWAIAIFVGIGLGLAMQWTTIMQAYADQGIIVAIAYLLGASLLTIPVMFLVVGSAFAPLPPD